jgi:polyphenol oxidase
VTVHDRPVHEQPMEKHPVDEPPGLPVDLPVDMAVDLPVDVVIDLPGNGYALFTTQAQGNLSTLRGDGHEHGEAERERLCGELGLGWLSAGPQVHGTTVHRIDVQSGSGGRPDTVEADGRMTSLREVGVMVLTADCVPVILGSDHAVASLHAGWRGLASGVLEKGVHALGDLGPTGGIVAIVGPSAGPCCYEVGPEVHGVFSDVHRHGSNLDLGALACERLQRAGVDRVHRMDTCTICDERFFSHRREAGQAGRQAAIAWRA